MRTKTLLLSAAALAAGILSSQAQSNVYSANIVGYVNVVIPANTQTLVANPLDDGSNTVTSLGAALPNKSSVQLWNGTGYTGTSKGGGTWTVNLSIPVGTGFFVKSPSALTNTFVGNVIIPSGGSNNVALPGGALVLVGASVPYAGLLNDPYNLNSLNLGASLPNKSSVQVWNGSNGFLGSSKGGGSWTVNFNLIPGQGFFVKSATATNWAETLPPAN
jgi:hypothetical protein